MKNETSQVLKELDKLYKKGINITREASYEDLGIEKSQERYRGIHQCYVEWITALKELLSKDEIVMIIDSGILYEGGDVPSAPLEFIIGREVKELIEKVNQATSRRLNFIRSWKEKLEEINKTQEEKDIKKNELIEKNTKIEKSNIEYKIKTIGNYGCLIIEKEEIKISKPTSRPYKLLSCLFRNLGVQKTNMQVINEIKIPKDNNKENLYLDVRGKEDRLNIIKSAKREIQRAIRKHFNDNNCCLENKLKINIKSENKAGPENVWITIE